VSESALVGVTVEIVLANLVIPKNESKMSVAILGQRFIAATNSGDVSDRFD